MFSEQHWTFQPVKDWQHCDRHFCNSHKHFFNANIWAGNNLLFPYPITLNHSIFVQSFQLASQSDRIEVTESDQFSRPKICMKTHLAIVLVKICHLVAVWGAQLGEPCIWVPRVQCVSKTARVLASHLQVKIFLQTVTGTLVNVVYCLLGWDFTLAK